MSKSVLLLQTLEMLRKKPGITVPELAAELGRSQRTVYRYLSDLISELNIPVSCQDGTYRLTQSDGMAALSSIRLSETVATSEEQNTIKVRFSARVASMINENSYHQPQTVAELGSGEVVLIFHAADYEEIIRWLLSFGEEAEVLEPQEIRRRMGCAAGRILRLYEPPAVKTMKCEEASEDEGCRCN